MTKEPSKDDFEGISEEDYKKLIVDQWKKIQFPLKVLVRLIGRLN